MRDPLQPEYERRRSAHNADFDRATARSANFVALLFGTLLLFGYAAYQATGNLSRAWWLALPFLAILVFGRLLIQARRQRLVSLRLLTLYEQGLARLDGTRPLTDHTGEAFRADGHLYDRDLTILGPHSLFAMLATTRTAVGQRALAGLLLHPADASEARNRQLAVQELAPLLDLRDQIALLGQSAFDDLPAESFDRWLSQPSTGLALWMRWIVLAVTAAWLALAGIALVDRGDEGGLPRDIAAVLAIEGAFALWLKPRVAAELEFTQRLSGQTEILRQGLRILQSQTFQSPLLVHLQQAAAGEDQALGSLARSLMLVEQRAKEWYYIPALLLAVGTHAAISLQLWKQQHGESMRRWLDTWAQFEALLAIATYAAEHAASVYPEIVDSPGAMLSAEGLAHPLLPAQQAIANDVNLGAETRFLLISGSNMAGKSTLLRSLGCNVVLALAGAPVFARSMRMTALRVGASLALVDSLAEGKSKFLAEVERLRDLVALAETSGPAGCLFLIDEIFSGTNSADRRAAAEAVLYGLISAGAIGALSTHDLALADLAELAALHGRNVHMASPDADDPLGFDYLLKPGVNRSTNALAIVKMLGLGGHPPV